MSRWACGQRVSVVQAQRHVHGVVGQRTGDALAPVALNFYGALYGIRAVLPIMRAQGGGHIVDIISGIAFAPMAGQTMYAVTKAALNGLTLALRYELWVRISA